MIKNPLIEIINKIEEHTLQKVNAQHHVVVNTIVAEKCYNLHFCFVFLFLHKMTLMFYLQGYIYNVKSKIP